MYKRNSTEEQNLTIHLSGSGALEGWNWAAIDLFLVDLCTPRWIKVENFNFFIRRLRLESTEVSFGLDELGLGLH